MNPPPRRRRNALVGPTLAVAIFALALVAILVTAVLVLLARGPERPLTLDVPADLLTATRWPTLDASSGVPISTGTAVLGPTQTAPPQVHVVQPGENPVSYTHLTLPTIYSV